MYLSLDRIAPEEFSHTPENETLMGDISKILNYLNLKTCKILTIKSLNGQWTLDIKGKKKNMCDSGFNLKILGMFGQIKI